MAARQLSTRRFAALAVVLIGAIGAGVWWMNPGGDPELAQVRSRLENGDVESALRTLEAIEPTRLADAEANFLLAVANRRHGRSSRAETYLARAEKLGWSKSDIEFQRMLLRAQFGDVADAEAYLASDRSESTSNADAEQLYEALAKGYLSTHRAADADRCLEFWSNWRPERIEPRLWRADLFVRTSNHENAIKEYEALLKIAPDHVEARVAFANVLLNLNQVERAREELNKVGERINEFPSALLARAEILHRQGDPDESERIAKKLAADRSVTVDVRAGALVQLARLAAETGKSDEAERAAREALRLDPHNPHSPPVLATALAQQGRSEEAKAELEKAKLISKRLDRLTDIATALTTKPDDVELRYEAGELFLQQGMADEAVRWWRTVLQYDPDHAKTLEALRRLSGRDSALK